MSSYITVIAYVQAMQGEQPVRIYADDTERTFASANMELANAYAAYLVLKHIEVAGFAVDVYEKQVVDPAAFDIDAMRRADAIAKLTPEELQLLNID